jgi:hypothetical protein
MKQIIVCLALLSIFLTFPAFARENWESPAIDYKQDLGEKSLSELRQLRNTVYAIHGYEFKQKELKDYFWSLPWYQHIRRDMEKSGQQYSDGMLSQEERQFIQRVSAKEEELIKKGKGPKRPGQLYTLDIVANLRQFPNFTGASRPMLEDNGFLVRPARHEQFFYLYDENDEQNIPNFITSDSVLQLYHLFFDFSLRHIEQEKLLSAATLLSSRMLEQALSTYNTTKEEKIKRAAGMLIVYYAVAQDLFTGAPPVVPRELTDRVQEELNLIKAHAGRSVSPCFGQKMDYSQFIPRGHYTRSNELKRYFLGMLWFGQSQFDLKADDQVRAVQLSTYYLLYYAINDPQWGKGQLKGLWETVYEPTTFYVGRVDDLSPEHVQQAMKEVYGEKVFQVAQLADDAKLQKIRKRLLELNPQKVKTAYFDMPNVGVRFMGQRYVPDSEIFQRLTKYGKRNFPKGLDIFAVLNIPEAIELLDTHYQEPARWSGYLPERERLTKEFAARPASDWEQNLYWSWLDCLRVLLQPSHPKAPAFAHSRAWRYKQLHTALASWVELRHDTILYAKPSGAQAGDGEEPPKVRGYVEPVPEFFDRLVRLLKQGKEGLGKRNLLTKRFEGAAQEMGDLLAFLERIARKEVNGEKIQDAEYDEIRVYGSKLEGLTTRMLGDESSSWDELVGPDRNVGVVADIATARSEALEEGVGTVDEIFVVIEVNGVLTLTRGGVFSYYEFTWPVSDRLTDERWQLLLKENKAPARPDWINLFLVPEWMPKMPRT